MQPQLPHPRGPLTRSLFGYWLHDGPLGAADLTGIEPLVDDDLHLALWACYQLHYGGFAEIDDDVEWDPFTLAFRARLERAFERALRLEHRAETLPADPVTALRVVAAWSGPPLASTVGARGERRHLAEVAVHRCAYQLKEADPHTWGIPRLAGPARSAMIEIQADEYGHGRPGCSHAEIFARAMGDLGLTPEVGAHIDRLPGSTLATDNLVTMFGLHRRLRGALVGHLALFEMCSVEPMSHYLAAARRVGDLADLERFYEVHVTVDTHHGDLALNQMVAPLAAAQPDLGADIVFGATALSRVESRFARHILRCWDQGESSLLPGPVATPFASPA